MNLEKILVLPQKHKIKWNPRNKEYYVSKGYTFTNMKDEVEVNVLDLMETARVIVSCYCQYCNEKCNRRLDRIHKDNRVACDKCRKYKQQETSLERYGFENHMQSEKIKNKVKQTNIERYGVEYPIQLDEKKEKRKQTCLNKWGINCSLHSNEAKEKSKETMIKNWGVEYSLQSKEVREKGRQTLLNKFGVESPAQSTVVQEKMKQTTLERYGVKYYSQTLEARQRAREDLVNRINKDSGPSTSDEQIYLYELLGGELNYCMGDCFLDIAFPDEMIYIEYDGSGHDLSVKLGGNRDKFNKREMDRQYAMKNLGWKLIRIVSREDYLPSDETILSLISKSKDIVNNGRSWIRIDIDNLTFEYKGTKENLHNLNLRKI